MSSPCTRRVGRWKHPHSDLPLIALRNRLHAGQSTILYDLQVKLAERTAKETPAVVCGADPAHRVVCDFVSSQPVHIIGTRPS